MRKSHRSLTLILLVIAVLARPGYGWAASPDSMAAELQQIAGSWAAIVYRVKDVDEQRTEMTALAEKAAAVANRYPDRAEPLIWRGVIASSEAKYANPFSALAFAKDARRFLETAGRIDYRALGGAVPTSLGALYYLVPGFPLAFGDDDKARQYLEQGIAINPNGLDANYFYGDFLFRQGEYRKAAQVLNQALGAPADPSRPVWYEGRRAEVKAVLAEVTQKLASRD
jgi:tetratricopeptide (TPR) repeat protein